MAYTTIDDPTQYFNTVLFTGDIVDGDGTGHDQAVTGVGFQPDWVWHKCRSHANQHMIVDSARGTGGSPTQMLTISSQDANAEFNSNTNGIIESLDSDGFTVTSGNDSSSKSNNAGANGRTYVDWCWKAETAFSNDASATSVGTLDSAGRINTTAGLAIITTTGTGSAATIAHGLGAAPAMIMSKRRDSGSSNWRIYNKNLSSNSHILFLDNTDAEQSGNSATWNNTAPTSTVFSVGASGDVNASSGTFVHYCFAEVKGYSKIGKYRGNGESTDGTFVYTGFRPAWVMVKMSSSTGNWSIFDNKRSSFNVVDEMIKGNDGQAELADSSRKIDFISSGFKIKANHADINTSGGTYIYMAFAENPFVNSNGLPVNAR